MLTFPTIYYKIWAVVQQQVYEKRVNDVDELCQRLLSVCLSMTKRHRRNISVTTRVRDWRFLKNIEIA